MDIKNNTVFGKVEYDFGWRKKEKINLFQKDFEIEIVAYSYPGEGITSIQEEEYKWFKNNLKKIEKKLQSLIENYVSKKIEEAQVEIKEVIFSNDKKEIVIIIECNLNDELKEEGIGILIKNNLEYKISSQGDIL